MENLSLSTAPTRAAEPQMASDEFQLEMVDFGSAYQAAEEAAATCLRCYCGSGCLCGCIAAA